MGCFVLKFLIWAGIYWVLIYRVVIRETQLYCIWYLSSWNWILINLWMPSLQSACVPSHPSPPLPSLLALYYICKFRDLNYIQLTPVCLVQQRFSCTPMFSLCAESVFWAWVLLCNPACHGPVSSSRIVDVNCHIQFIHLFLTQKLSEKFWLSVMWEC